MEKVTSVLFVGVGGQGVLKASDILARAAFLAGFDVKKSEVHGMSQRGGGVTSTVRFGRKIYSPLAPAGSADFLVAFDRTEGEKYTDEISPGGRVFFITDELLAALSEPRTANVALLGALSARFGIEDGVWREAIRREMPEKFVAMNVEAFEAGRELEKRRGAK